MNWMQSCLAVGIMVSVCCGSGNPHHQTLLCHQIFGFALIRLPCCCLHSSSSSSALHRPPGPSLSGCNSMSSNGEQILLLYVPSSFFHLVPHTLDIQPHWLCGVLSHSHLSVHTACPHVPEPGSSALGHRRKVKDGPCHSLLLLQGAPVPSVFPQPSVMRLTIYGSLNPRSCECRKALSPACSVPGPLHLLCLLPGMFSHIVSGLPCLLSKIVAPLAFLQSRHHGLIVYFLYCSVSPIT